MDAAIALAGAERNTKNPLTDILEQGVAVTEDKMPKRTTENEVEKLARKCALRVISHATSCRLVSGFRGVIRERSKTQIPNA